MSGKVFISYRREDARATAGRIYDRLVRTFGATNVFMDVDSIPPGCDFNALLERFVSETDVMLVIIGPNWLDGRGADGERRLFASDDIVRTEIASALAQEKRIIPVLVDRANMLSPGDLPESIAAIERLQAFEIRHNRFGADVTDLIGAIESLTGRRKLPIRALAIGFVFVALFTSVAWLALQYAASIAWGPESAVASAPTIGEATGARDTKAGPAARIDDEGKPAIAGQQAAEVKLPSGGDVPPLDPTAAGEAAPR